MNKILKQKDIRTLRQVWLNYQRGRDAAIPTLEVENATLDHDHADGYCRGVLDREVNQFLGKVESAYKRFIRYKGISLEMALDGIARYIRADFSSNPLHPGHVKTLSRTFNSLPVKAQVIRLKSLGIEPKETKDLRLKQYKKYLLSEVNTFRIRQGSSSDQNSVRKGPKRVPRNYSTPRSKR